MDRNTVPLHDHVISPLKEVGIYQEECKGWIIDIWGSQAHATPFH
jgi:hypothetical protein